ncbi:MAG: tyrosine-type recombinase/integrase [Mogibacterium sp.]|jgi:integrase|nr:tyrosine-type recombinase/integrase [Mogibacterium sp.]MEE1169557.1 tyrosine-type recombinase/integrase [Anaerovoracaceae bacterium]
MTSKTPHEEIRLQDLYSADDVLSTIYEQGILDEDGVRLIMRKKHLQFVLSHHEHKIWQSADGRWKTYITDEESGKRKQISRESREDLEDFLYDKYLAEDEELAKKRATMESLYDDWAEYKSLFVSESTIKRDRNTWKALYKDAPIVKKPLVSVTKTELERWLLSVIRSKNMNSHQFNNFISVIRQLMAYAEEIGIIDSNPVEKIRIQKKRILKPEIKGPTITQVFMEDERQLLIKYAMEQYNKHRDTVQIFTSLAIAFLLYVPLRRGELVALRFDDLDGNRLILTDSYSHDMKCLKGRLKDIEGWRAMDVVPPALEIIERIRQERIRLGMPTDGCIFTVNEKYGSLYSALGKSINKYCDEIGIPRRSLHKTRKTCASKMHADGVNDLIIQAQLGHKDLRTTFNSYCYDVTTDAERYRAISASLA